MINAIKIKNKYKIDKPHTPQNITWSWFFWWLRWGNRGNPKWPKVISKKWNDLKICQHWILHEFHLKRWIHPRIFSNL